MSVFAFILLLIFHKSSKLSGGFIKSRKLENLHGNNTDFGYVGEQNFTTKAPMFERGFTKQISNFTTCYEWFHDEISRGVTFVLFYGSGKDCEYCRAVMPKWDEYYEENRSNARITIAKVDCLEPGCSYVCQEEGVHKVGYPAVFEYWYIIQNLLFSN